MSTKPNPLPSDQQPVSSETLRRLLVQAQAGDFSVLARLRQVLDDRPDLWKQFGSLAVHAEASIVQLAAGKDLLLAESMIRQQTALKAELAGDEANPLEQSLAERVAICALSAAYWDAVIAQSRAAAATPAQLDPVRRHLDSANQRYLAAAKTLATVRKLLRPALSPLQLASRAVPETSSTAVERRQRAAAPLAGTPVCN